ncbi:hypothetical protein EK0264_18575 [Epidermidibacterium keratini]|uniref:VOC domain-containing protein n=1 Tax=Epidermidibacterium keratini TaxID=1891644 RepID=A0A7L4YSC2_9ACTN|nr:VOC family protein [Epidermidibacterium keratini]QHC02076.1 hypothetical protein EK0264_18575 [Epidermidibacterium keratini]
MIEGFARLSVPVADETEATWLGSLAGSGNETAPRLGSTTIMPSTTAGQIEIDFAVDEPTAARRLAARRGLDVAHDRVRCRGLEFGLATRGEAVAGAKMPGAAYGLDHVVIHTADPEGAVAAYGGRLGLDLRLDRQAPQWGARMMFFRCGNAVLEVVSPQKDPPSPERDEVWGLALRVDDLEALRERMSQSGAAFQIGAVRDGRKPGTRVASVRGTRAPILLIEPADNQVTGQ